MERIDGANSITLPGGGAGFADRNLTAGIAGTTLTAKWANNVQEEIVSILTAAGIALDGTNFGQMLAALQVLFPVKANVIGGGGGGWVDVSASRAIGVTYTNSTGRPIVVSVNCSSSSTCNAAWWVNGVQRGVGPTVAATAASPTFFIVPAGATYKVTVSAGAGTLTTGNWVEM